MDEVSARCGGAAVDVRLCPPSRQLQRLPSSKSSTFLATCVRAARCATGATTRCRRQTSARSSSASATEVVSSSSLPCSSRVLTFPRAVDIFKRAQRDRSAWVRLTRSAPASTGGLGRASHTAAQAAGNHSQAAPSSRFCCCCAVLWAAMHIKHVRARRAAGPGIGSGRAGKRLRAWREARARRLVPPAAPAISQIELSGFKSYKHATTGEPLSPNINVVVGANGSGKSNFFHGARAPPLLARPGSSQGQAASIRSSEAWGNCCLAFSLLDVRVHAAIRFVLNDTFTNMRPEERQQLLHVRGELLGARAAGRRGPAVVGADAAAACAAPLLLPAARRRARATPCRRPTWRSSLTTRTGACRCGFTRGGDWRQWGRAPERRAGRQAACCPHPCPPAQVDKDEVRLRRTITKAKDEFQLDRKHIKCAVQRVGARGAGQGEGVSSLRGSAGRLVARPRGRAQQPCARLSRAGWVPAWPGAPVALKAACGGDGVVRVRA